MQNNVKLDKDGEAELLYNDPGLWDYSRLPCKSEQVNEWHIFRLAPITSIVGVIIYVNVPRMCSWFSINLQRGRFPIFIWILYIFLI